MRRLSLCPVTLALLTCGALPGHAAGRWVSPLAGPLVVRRGFHPPAQRWLAGHRGVDLAGRPGSVVRAAGAGVVTFAGVLAGRGVVVVRHGMLRTTYEPVRATVAVGARVVMGQRIGRLMAGHGSPRPGEWLLHWGLLRGDDYLNPLLLLRRGPPRLLPLWTGRVGSPPGPGSSFDARVPSTGLAPRAHADVGRQRSARTSRGAVVAIATTSAGVGGVAVVGARRARRRDRRRR
ncbi:MAG: M23 family metallopeptidase [Frankia sp.]|nr:M23 family metallopeptidase [Frankia sp.]